MYAIMISGGKQHKVREGAIVKLEKLESGVGDKITFDQVLMFSDEKTLKIGEPLLKDVTVNAEVVEQGRDKKINILKFRLRKHSMKRQGHRQYFTAVKITKIETKKAAPKKVAATKTEPKKAAPTKPVAKKPEAKKATTKTVAAKKTETKK